MSHEMGSSRVKDRSLEVARKTPQLGVFMVGFRDLGIPGRCPCRGICSAYLETPTALAVYDSLRLWIARHRCLEEPNLLTSDLELNPTSPGFFDSLVHASREREHRDCPEPICHYQLRF